LSDLAMLAERGVEGVRAHMLVGRRRTAHGLPVQANPRPVFDAVKEPKINGRHVQMRGGGLASGRPGPAPRRNQLIRRAIRRRHTDRLAIKCCFHRSLAQLYEMRMPYRQSAEDWNSPTPGREEGIVTAWGSVAISGNPGRPLRPSRRGWRAPVR
jgi:hypothetical protein